MFWTEKMQPKVLVACPTFSGMAYSLKQWADAYHAFTYKNKGALMVDNSDENLHYTHLIRAQGIPCLYQEKRFDFMWDTLELSWALITDYAVAHGYDLVASIEADVICEPKALSVLVDEWEKADRRAIVAHRYHPRGIDNLPEGVIVSDHARQRAMEECWFDTLGCTLIPVELLKIARYDVKAIFEVDIYLKAADNGYERVRLKDRFDIQHLDDPERKAKQMSANRAHPAELSKNNDKRDEREKRSMFAQTPTIPDPNSEAAKAARDALKWNLLMPEEQTCA